MARVANESCFDGAGNHQASLCIEGLDCSRVKSYPGFYNV